MSMETFIRGDTRLVFLLGNPVAHSLSPQIHNHAFRALGMPVVYIPLAVKNEGLHHAIYALRACSAVGANVTLPYKQRTVSFCDVLSPLASRLGVVNTLYFRGNLLCGATTDPEGFLRALARMGHDAHGGSVVILGNGGTARTLAAALALERIPKSLTLVGRNLERVAALAAEVSGVTGVSVPALSLDDRKLPDVMAACTLLVNCTSAGMYPATQVTPIDKRYFHRRMTVFDTIYNPAATRLLKESEAAGCPVQNGLHMLLYQALASLTLWTGVAVREELFDLDELQKSCSG